MRGNPLQGSASLACAMTAPEPPWLVLARASFNHGLPATHPTFYNCIFIGPCAVLRGAAVAHRGALAVWRRLHGGAADCDGLRQPREFLFCLTLSRFGSLLQ